MREVFLGCFFILRSSNLADLRPIISFRSKEETMGDKSPKNKEKKKKKSNTKVPSTSPTITSVTTKK
jgi:hypothetical protein